MNATFAGSRHEEEILTLTRYAYAKKLKIERIHGPALTNAGKVVTELYGYNYSATARKIIYVVCH